MKWFKNHCVSIWVIPLLIHTITVWSFTLTVFINYNHKIKEKFVLTISILKLYSVVDNIWCFLTQSIKAELLKCETFFAFDKHLNQKWGINMTVYDRIIVMVNENTNWTVYQFVVYRVVLCLNINVRKSVNQCLGT